MMHFPSCPFKIIFVLAVDNNNEIQLIHLLENPICLGIAKRKFQLTESKALAISTLKEHSKRVSNVEEKLLIAPL